MTFFAGVDLSPSSSGLVLVDQSGAAVYFSHFKEEKSLTNMFSRFRMAERMFKKILEQDVTLVGIEDYDLNRTQQVGYQIAETTGLLKYLLITTAIPFVLIHPRKRQSYVRRTKIVTKDDVIEWAKKEGFSPPVKGRGSDVGYYKRQREDLADAFCLARMARELNVYLSEGIPPRKGHIFLDPDYGLAFRPDLLYNVAYEGELDEFR